MVSIGYWDVPVKNHLVLCVSNFQILSVSRPIATPWTTNLLGYIVPKWIKSTFGVFDAPKHLTIEEERRRVNGIARPSASFVRKETLKTLPDTHNSTFALRSTRNRQWAGHLRSESEIPEGSQRDFWLCCLRYFFRIPLSGNVYTIFFRPSAPRTAKLSSRKPSYGPVYPFDPPSLILYDLT